MNQFDPAIGVEAGVGDLQFAELQMSRQKQVQAAKEIGLRIAGELK